MKQGLFDFIDLPLILQLLAFKVMHIKDVGDLIPFYAGHGDLNVQAEVKERAGYQVQEPDPVGREYLDQCKKVR